MIHPQSNEYDYGLGIDPNAITYIRESQVVNSRISSTRCYLFQRTLQGSAVGSAASPTTIASYYQTSPYYAAIIWASGGNHPDTRAYVSQGAGALRLLIDGVEATRVLAVDDIIADNEFAVVERWDLSPARVEVAFNTGFDPSAHTVQYYYTTINEGVVKEFLKRGDSTNQSLFGWEQYTSTTCDAYRGRNQILVRMPLTTRDLVVKEEGAITLEENDSWMIWEPYVRDFDLIIVPAAYAMSGTNEWYEVVDKKDSIIQGSLITQRFKLHLLEASDPRTQLTIATS